MANLSNINNILRVSSSGVGLNKNNTGPSELDIESSGADMIDMTRTGQKTYRFAISGASAFSLFDVAANADRLIINTSGNATFAGDVTISKTGNAALTITGGTTNTAIINFGDSSNDDAGIIAYTNDAGGSDHMAFTVATNEKMRITSAGKVGIGTTSPSGALSVENTGTAGVPVLDVINTSNAQFNHSGEMMTPNMLANQNNIFVIGRQSTTKESGYIGYKWSSSGSNANVLTFGHWGSDNLMNINGIGNVGIGTTNPQGKLQITTGDSGASSAWTNADELILESSGNAGLAFQTPNTGAATIAFQDPESVQAGFIQYLHADNALRFATNGNNERMRITSTGAISVGSTGTAYGAAGEVLTSNGNAAPSWQAAGGGGSAWPQEKFAEYTIDSTTSNILIATMNPTTWHGNELAGCLKFTINASDYIQVSYITVSTFLSGSNQWFFKGNSEMTTHNGGTNPIRYVFAFAGNNGSYGTTCTLKINRYANTSLYTKVNVLVQAVSSPDMFILN